MWCLLLVFAAFSLHRTTAIPHGGRDDSIQVTRCGYDRCTSYQPGVLNVHIVPHTHDDVGWLKTVDQYYYGSLNNIQHAGVQYILDSVVTQLAEDPGRRFIYVETAFFWKWWTKQSKRTQNLVHKLVREGRLQFVGGAWSMNDEAATHYQSTIDQFTFGLKKLNETFGPCAMPRVGWQIDPFGHSREFASLLAGMGYDGLFLGRVDYQDKGNRLKKKEMEMMWRGDDDLGKPSDIFTGILYNTYSPPPGFCFDIFCSDEPIIEDVNSPLYNVDQRVNQFLNLAVSQSKNYMTNNILVTMGGDFNYQDAAAWFTNLDKLIKHTNLVAAKENLNLTLYYSTPDCYLKAVKEANPTLPVKQDDFMPYASDPTAFWSGYFTSRTNLKLFERIGNSHLQIVKRLQVIAGLPYHNEMVIDELRNAMGVMQHHDAVTGTEKQHVANDYARILTNALDDTMIVATQALNKLSSNDEVKFDLRRCNLNISECSVSEQSDAFIVTVFNSVSWKLPVIDVKFPIMEYSDGLYEIYAPNGDKIDFEAKEIPPYIKQIPSRKSKANFEIHFEARNIKPLGYKTFYVRKVKSDNIDGSIDDDVTFDGVVGTMRAKRLHKRFSVEDIIFNENSKIVRDASPTEKSGMMGDDPMIIQRFEDNVHPLLSNFVAKHELLVYSAYAGNNNAYANRSSGAYIFRPKDLIANKTIVLNESQKTYTSQRPHFVVNLKEVRKNSVTLEYVIPGIDITDGLGKEFIARFTVGANGPTDYFYTDSNGRQDLRRVRDQRPTWNLTLAEPMPGNFYPANRITIQKDNFTMMILTDRPVAAGNFEDGAFDLLIHRRLLRDDGFGVDEALNETDHGKGIDVIIPITLYVSESRNDVLNGVKLGITKQVAPQVFLSNANLDVEGYRKLKNCNSGLNKELDEGVHVLTLEQWDENKILVRLENLLVTSENSTKQVDLGDLFSTFRITNVVETALAANFYKKDVNVWDWKTKSDFVNKDVCFDKTCRKQNGRSDKNLVVTLNAKEIRTFIADYVRN